MKIQKIEVHNLKAISNQEITLDGCSAIITGANNSGKSTLLRGLMDRLRGEKPQIIVKEGEEKGFSTMELTDGSVIKWKFTTKSESFSYTSPDGAVQRTGVLKAIGEKYFGTRFDVDQFLNATPKTQSKILGKLVGVDFTDINERYAEAYAARTDAKKTLDLLRANLGEAPIKVEAPNIDAIKAAIADLEETNSIMYTDWKAENEKARAAIAAFNYEQEVIKSELEEAIDAKKDLVEMAEGVFEAAINLEMVDEILQSIPDPQEPKIFVATPEPTYHSFDKLNKQLDEANFQLGTMANYTNDLKAYNLRIKNGKAAKLAVQKAEELVSSINAEKMDKIKNANIPKEFTFNDGTVLYKGLPLDSNQVSSSGKYIAALKLGAMALGEAKAIHFDASFLDKVSLKEIEEWAVANDLQLLIERPDFDAGEIRYDIISKA